MFKRKETFGWFPLSANLHIPEPNISQWLLSYKGEISFSMMSKTPIKKK